MNHIERQNINPCTCGHLIFDELSSTTQWGKKTFSTNGSGQSVWLHAVECK